MSDPQYFWDLLEQVYELRETAIDQICDAADEIVDMLNSAANSLGGRFVSMWPGDSEIETAIKRWNDDICPALEEAIGKIRTELDDALDELSGNPSDLKNYAEAFANAKTDLYKKASIAQELTTLGQHWEGHAYESYRTVATEQHKALLDLAHSLERGGQNTMQAANQILHLWRTLVREFASYNSDILNLLAAATNAANIISFEVPAILQTIAKIWENVWDLADILLTFMIDQATRDMFNWLMLKNGSDGLPANTWPTITEDSSDTINDSGAWVAG